MYIFKIDYMKIWLFSETQSMSDSRLRREVVGRNIIVYILD